MQKIISKNKILDFKKNGYIIYRNLISKGDIHNAKDDLINFITKNKHKFSKREINFTKSGNINSIHNLNDWKWTKNLKKNKKILTIVSELLEDNISEFGAELFSKPAKVGLGSPMHQDNYYWCLNNPNAVTIWIALEDSSKENGGVYYLSKSHKLGLLEHTASNVPGSSQMIKYQEGLKVFKVDFPILKAGDCIIHHSLIAHGSKANKSKYSRIGWTLRFKSKSAYIDKFLKKRYEHDLSKQLKDRK